jgi:hypothetical protein
LQAVDSPINSIISPSQRHTCDWVVWYGQVRSDRVGYYILVALRGLAVATQLDCCEAAST